MEETERKGQRSLSDEGPQADLEQLQKLFSKLGEPLHPELGVS
jgi:hypothetical protein